MAERSESITAKRSFASKLKRWDNLTQIIASRFLLRFAQQFLTKFKRTTNCSFSPEGLRKYLQFYDVFVVKREKQRDFSDWADRNSVSFFFHSDFLERDDSVISRVSRSVDDSVSAFADAVQLFEFGDWSDRWDSGNCPQMSFLINLDVSRHRHFSTKSYNDPFSVFRVFRFAQASSRQRQAAASLPVSGSAFLLLPIFYEFATIRDFLFFAFWYIFFCFFNLNF